MWIASQLGFFSIVQKEGCFHVRARCRADLAELRRAAGIDNRIEEWPQADYRFRLRVGAIVLEKIFRALEASVDYPNFKSRIAELPDQKEKLAAYGRLWLALAELQHKDERHHHQTGHDHAGIATAVRHHEKSARDHGGRRQDGAGGNLPALAPAPGARE